MRIRCENERSRIFNIATVNGFFEHFEPFGQYDVKVKNINNLSMYDDALRFERIVNGER